MAYEYVTCHLCGDSPADWTHDGQPTCLDCFRELKWGIIPGPEILGLHTHVPEGVRLVQGNCQPGLTQAERRKADRRRNEPDDEVGGWSLPPDGQ